MYIELNQDGNLVIALTEDIIEPLKEDSNYILADLSETPMKGMMEEFFSGKVEIRLVSKQKEAELKLEQAMRSKNNKFDS